MDRYDPDTAPDSSAWLALGEEERFALVERFHREAKIPLPSSRRRLHAIIHAIVETQVLTDEEPIVRETLARMMAEGLDRHDAIHAVGWVLAGYMQDVVTSRGDTSIYRKALQELTPASWRAGDIGSGPAPRR